MRKKVLYKATFAAGCFWCADAAFRMLDGMSKVVCGYAGGKHGNPSYEQVLKGNTEHGEAVQIEYDPSKISYEDILNIFWNIHDPTTPNRQGSDVGPQYQAVIFWHNE